jgi:riboflavin synthase
LFTGLIENVGEVVRGTGSLVVVKSPLAAEIRTGDSVAVDGACLTVTGIAGQEMSFHTSRETLSRTIAVDYIRGTPINLELSLEIGDRLHGHMVSGHIDCTSRVLVISKGREDRLIRISLPEVFSDLVVERGSVALNGISLTVVEAESKMFSVVVIPETLTRTTAGGWKPGTGINIEFDILGKYVARRLRLLKNETRLKAFLEGNLEH